MKTILKRLKPHLTARQMQVCKVKNRHRNAQAAAEALGIERPAVLKILREARAAAEANGVLIEFLLLAGEKASGKTKIAVYELLSSSPDKVFTSAEICTLVGSKCHAEIKSLADRDIIDRCDYDQYRAKRQESINYWLRTPWRKAA